MRDFGARGDRSVQIEMGGTDIVPVDDDQKDHKGRAQDYKNAEHPGRSHGDCCLLQGHHGNRVKVQERSLSLSPSLSQHGDRCTESVVASDLLWCWCIAGARCTREEVVKHQ